MVIEAQSTKPKKIFYKLSYYDLIYRYHSDPEGLT